MVFSHTYNKLPASPYISTTWQWSCDLQFYLRFGKETLLDLWNLKLIWHGLIHAVAICAAFFLTQSKEDGGWIPANYRGYCSHCSVVCHSILSLPSTMVQSNYNFTLSHVIMSINAWLRRKRWRVPWCNSACLTSMANIYSYEDPHMAINSTRL